MHDPTQAMESGEKARLFPVLSESSKEGRATSILLSCIPNVPEFGHSILQDAGIRMGSRCKIETFTEVTFPGAKLRPDGLIMVKTAKQAWSALVEAKIGNADLQVEQIEGYLELAKANNINAVITISNQFAPLATHHPLVISAAARKKATLLHWSWMHVLTEASLLLQGDLIEDLERRIILNEFVRFLTHTSAGVKGFNQMPPAWIPVVQTIQSGGMVAQSSVEAKEVIGAWHQEGRDLTMILSRQLGLDVTIKTKRTHALDHQAYIKSDLRILSTEAKLQTALNIPNAAALVDVCADLQTKTISVSMRLKAPEDRKTTKARTNWLLRQVQRADPQNIHVRFYWPGRGAFGQYPLVEVRNNPDIGAKDKPNAVVTSFEIVLVNEIGARFNKRKNFISELERIVPEFYERMGQNLKAWQAPAPRLKDDNPESVAPAALAEIAEQADFEPEENQDISKEN